MEAQHAIPWIIMTKLMAKKFEGEIFGSTPPNFDITITESNPDSMWYSLNSGTTNITFGSLTGAIDQTEWNSQGRRDNNYYF